MKSYSHEDAVAIRVPNVASGPFAPRPFKWLPWSAVLTLSMFLPLSVEGRPATIGPDEQLYQQFDRGPHGPSSAWKVRLHPDNDDCVDPSLNCFYFQQQADSSWALYTAVATDLSTLHPDNACHLGAPADPGTYRLFALNTSKACILRVTFRVDR
jgi:hypothetical protein